MHTQLQLRKLCTTTQAAYNYTSCVQLRRLCIITQAAYNNASCIELHKLRTITQYPLLHVVDIHCTCMIYIVDIYVYVVYKPFFTYLSNILL